MDNQTLLALFAFCVVTLFTPGPNNLMLMASGANFGVVRTLPHMLGVVTGFPAMTAIVGLGLAGLFFAWSSAFTLLKVASVAYTLWLAWKIANAGAVDIDRPEGKPLSFAQAVAFQWINPKAWSMALTATTVYAPGQNAGSVLTIAGMFLLFGIGSSGAWMAMGGVISRWLSSPARLRLFNLTMALLLVGSIALAL
jgi:threonine/homoserine/homoserine lactone efflux protein